MCGIIDDILPVVGAVIGSVVPGLGTALGATIGGAIGGGISGYVQTHSLTGTLTGGLEGGAGGYLGVGGGLGSLMQGGAESAATIAPEAFQTGIAGATGSAASAFGQGATLGSLESGLGGAAMFGPAAGTGTALGQGGLSGLAGESLGIAGTDALSGITPNQFTSGLGGAGTGTGLPGQSGANLAGVMANNATGATGVTAATGGAPTAAPSPVAALSNNGTANMGLSGTPAQAGGSLEGTQAAPLPGGPGGNPGAAGVFTGGADTGGATGPMGFENATAGAEVAPGSQTGLSSLYGPTSTAGQSPMGASVSNGADTTGITSGVTANPTSTLGQGTPSKMDLSSLFGGGGEGGAASAGQLSPWLGLLKSGLGAYQQYAQQQAQNAYKGQIDQEFSPNSPYAQQMMQTLGRQDAAAGRNSQYGTRAVQLAAALTQAHANALGNPNYYRAATATPGANMFNSLLGMFANPQYSQGIQQLGSAGLNGLQSLFGG